MILRRTAAPGAEPITLSEAKVHLKVDHADDDHTIAANIEAAREMIEAETGRCLLPQDWEMWLPAFPVDGAPIILAHAPVLSVTWLRTVNAAGVVTTLDAASYQALIPAGPQAGPARLLPGAVARTWPSAPEGVAGAVRVAYRAGYAEVPGVLVAALKLALGDLYAGREGTIANLRQVNPTVARLLGPYRVHQP